MKRFSSSGHLAALLLIVSPAGITLGLTIGQWQEAVLWLVPLTVGLVIINRVLP